MIDELTPEMEARIPVIRDKWLQAGHSTGSCPRPLVHKVSQKAYEAAECKFPKKAYWAKSPFGGAIVAACLINDDKVPTETFTKVLNRVNEGPFQILSDVVDEKTFPIIEPTIREILDQAGYGTHDAAWLSFYDYFYPYILDEKGNKIIEKMMPLIEISPNVGWWWPLDEAVVFSERPDFVTVDDQNRLHNESRAAISYSDGIELFVWHGIEVEEYIITRPHEITPEKVLKEENQEIRRIMLERFGWHNLLRHLEAVEEQKDRFGTLYSTKKLGKYLAGEDPVAKFVLVKDSSTDREYALRVDPKSVTAHEGIAGTFRKRPEDYHPQQEA